MRVAPRGEFQPLLEPRDHLALHWADPSRVAFLRRRGAKCSVRTDPRMDVVSISTRTTLSNRLSSSRCPAGFRVSNATNAAASVAAT